MGNINYNIIKTNVETIKKYRFIVSVSMRKSLIFEKNLNYKGFV